MKFKLIHNKHKEEQYICTKETIEGYNYYVSEEAETNLDDLCYAKTANAIFVNVNPKLNSTDKLKVIATDNKAFTETSQIINDGEKAWEEANRFFKDGINPYAFSAGYRASQQLYPFSEQDIIDFLEWSAVNANPKFPNKNEWYLKSFNPPKEVSTSELLKFWKENHKLNILYYE